MLTAGALRAQVVADSVADIEATDSTDAHRKELSRYKDWQSLEKHLLAANWLPEFVQYCKDKGVAPNQQEIAKSKPLILRLVNAYIVRNILGDDGFFPLFERDDEITKKAVETLCQ